MGQKVSRQHPAGISVQYPHRPQGEETRTTNESRSHPGPHPGRIQVGIPAHPSRTRSHSGLIQVRIQVRVQVRVQVIQVIQVIQVSLTPRFSGVLNRTGTGGTVSTVFPLAFLMPRGQITPYKTIDNGHTT